MVKRSTLSAASSSSFLCPGVIMGLEVGLWGEGVDEELICRGAIGLGFEIAANTSTA